MLLATCFLHVYRYSMHLLFFCERVTPPFTLPALGTFPARGSRTGTTKPKSKTASQVEISAPSGIDLDCLVVRLRVLLFGLVESAESGLKVLLRDSRDGLRACAGKTKQTDPMPGFRVSGLSAFGHFRCPTEAWVVYI